MSYRFLLQSKHIVVPNCGTSENFYFILRLQSRCASAYPNPFGSALGLQFILKMTLTFTNLSKNTAPRGTNRRSHRIQGQKILNSLLQK